MNLNINRSLAAVFGLVTTTFGSLALPSPSYAGTPKCAANGQTPATSAFIRQMAKSNQVAIDGQPGVLNELSLPGTPPAGYEDAYGGY